MASVMAIVSKAVFEKEARGLGIGDVWPTARYASQNKGLAALAGGGDLYLVTVRPPETLCLVAVLRAPERDGDGWHANANTTPIRDIHALRGRLTFASGQPLPADTSKLGMSLQTPRVLTDDALSLLTSGAKAKPDAKSATSGPKAKPDAKSSTSGAKAKPDAKSSMSGAMDRADAKPATSGGRGSADAKPATSGGRGSADAKPATSSGRGSADAKPATSGGRGSADVVAIREALAAGRPAGALPGLLALWRREPSAALATLIATVSKEARVDPPGIEGKTKDVLQAWNKLAARPEPEHIPALLATLAGAPSKEAAERLERVKAWMPDPRVDAALAGWIETPPFHATMTKPFYTRVFQLARELRDPDQLARLGAADGTIARTIAPTMGDWLRAQLRKLVDEVSVRLAQVPATTPVVAELGGSVEAARTDTSSLDTLLAAVYADPASDGPRLVYADALSERGDPRGELIAVQCRLAETPGDRELRAREKALLASHAKKWLGELAPVLMADARFERGFLAACTVDGKRHKAAQALAGNPMWSTVHTFAGPMAVALHPVMRALRAFRYTGWLEENYSDDEEPATLPVAPWHELLVGATWPFESLTYRPGSDRTAQAIAALAEGKTLPQLRTLVIEDSPEDVAALLDAPVLDRLQTFGLHFDTSHHSDWLQRCATLIAKARAPELAFELTHASFHPTIVRLTREGAGYARAWIEAGPTSTSNWSDTLFNEVIEILRALPKLRHLELHTRRNSEEKAVARVARTGKQLGLETCAID